MEVTRSFNCLAQIKETPVYTFLLECFVCKIIIPNAPCSKLSTVALFFNTHCIYTILCIKQLCRPGKHVMVPRCMESVQLTLEHWLSWTAAEAAPFITCTCRIMTSLSVNVQKFCANCTTHSVPCAAAQGTLYRAVAWRASWLSSSRLCRA